MLRNPVISEGRGFLVALVLAFTIAPSALHADTLTLQQLIDRGSEGIIVGDKQFYDFSYLGSPTPSSGVPNPAPTADQIAVAPITGPMFGLSFSAGWEAAPGLNQDSLIRYYVHVLDGTPQQAIDSVGLRFNGADPLTGPLTNATVTETIETLGGTVLGQFSVYNDGTGASYDSLNNSITLPTPMRDLFVMKDIMVHSSTIGGVSTISFVDNTFHQIATPLPQAAWAGLLLIAGLAVWKRKTPPQRSPRPQRGTE